MLNEINWIHLKNKILSDKLIGNSDSMLENKYSTWRKLDSTDIAKMTHIGFLKFEGPNSNSEKAYHTDINYWSTNYPIALGYYPNNGCTVYSAQNSYFLIYTEFSGHAPEKRCRYVNLEIVIE